MYIVTGYECKIYWYEIICAIIFSKMFFSYTLTLKCSHKIDGTIYYKHINPVYIYNDVIFVSYFI